LCACSAYIWLPHAGQGSSSAISTECVPQPAGRGSHAGFYGAGGLRIFRKAARARSPASGKVPRYCCVVMIWR
jgi:hypothetical protein